MTLIATTRGAASKLRKEQRTLNLVIQTSVTGSRGPLPGLKQALKEEPQPVIVRLRAFSGRASVHEGKP